jgi:hypothetical protein
LLLPKRADPCPDEFRQRIRHSTLRHPRGDCRKVVASRSASGRTRYVEPAQIVGMLRSRRMRADQSRS